MQMSDARATLPVATYVRVQARERERERERERGGRERHAHCSNEQNIDLSSVTENNFMLNDASSTTSYTATFNPS